VTLPSVVEEVSSDFRDPRRGVNGKGGTGRVVADLWATYPDLEVSVEGNVVRTRLVLSGTDWSRGVIWYPPTRRWVSFEAEFADRFRGRAGRAHGVDTEGFLRQLAYR
jgi:hypothetical protein